MIKRLIDIARANLNHCVDKGAVGKVSADSITETAFGFDESESRRISQLKQAQEPFIQYYANLEISPGSDREAVKSAWKRMMKKYHPDLHESNPGKRKAAHELTLRLTESYRILDKELSKR